MKKEGRKLKDLIDEKPLKPNEKRRNKTDHLFFFVEDEKPPKPS